MGFAPKYFKQAAKHPERGGVVGPLSGVTPRLLPEGLSLTSVSWGRARSSETVSLPASFQHPLRCPPE